MTANMVAQRILLFALYFYFAVWIFADNIKSVFYFSLMIINQTLN